MIISLHAEVSASGNLLQLHDVIDNIEHRLQKELGCVAVIHMDPIVTDDPGDPAAAPGCGGKGENHRPRLTIHDFRMVPGPSHTNLIFDTVVPYGVKLDRAQVQKRIAELVRQLGEQYFAVVQIDNSYVL